MYVIFDFQPLMDNLESQTYEVFEKDPVKYNQYQEVIHHVKENVIICEWLYVFKNTQKIDILGHQNLAATNVTNL